MNDFFSGQFFSGDFFESAPVVVTTDSHDGVRRRRQQRIIDIIEPADPFKGHRERSAALRKTLEEAFLPKPAPLVQVTPIEVVEPKEDEEAVMLLLLS